MDACHDSPDFRRNLFALRCILPHTGPYSCAECGEFGAGLCELGGAGAALCIQQCACSAMRVPQRSGNLLQVSGDYGKLLGRGAEASAGALYIHLLLPMARVALPLRSARLLAA